uniref:Casein kinase II subunit beta n=1 Tax=Macrostomum lignano TaxID=282301 RepID=A0A1I8F6S1_9PLAT
RLAGVHLPTPPHVRSPRGRRHGFLCVPFLAAGPGLLSGLRAALAGVASSAVYIGQAEPSSGGATLDGGSPAGASVGRGLSAAAVAARPGLDQPAAVQEGGHRESERELFAVSSFPCHFTEPQLAGRQCEWLTATVRQRTAANWIAEFCDRPGNEFFCKTRTTSGTASTSLDWARRLPNYHRAMKLLLDGPGTAGLGQRRPAAGDSAAECRAAGMPQMVAKWMLGHFGVFCRRVFCEKQRVLPVVVKRFPGLSDIPGEATVKVYCPRCMEVYVPNSSRHLHVDGAYFGTGFPHLLFLSHPECRPKPPANQFAPSLYGFKIHPLAYQLQQAAAAAPSGSTATPASAPAATPGRQPKYRIASVGHAVQPAQRAPAPAVAASGCPGRPPCRGGNRVLASLTTALVDGLNSGWIKLVEDLNSALKEMGDVENWARSMERDMRRLRSCAWALESAYAEHATGAGPSAAALQKPAASPAPRSSGRRRPSPEPAASSLKPAIVRALRRSRRSCLGGRPIPLRRRFIRRLPPLQSSATSTTTTVSRRPSTGSETTTSETDSARLGADCPAVPHCGFSRDCSGRRRRPCLLRVCASATPDDVDNRRVGWRIAASSVTRLALVSSAMAGALLCLLVHLRQQPSVPPSSSRSQSGTGWLAALRPFGRACTSLASCCLALLLLLLHSAALARRRLLLCLRAGRRDLRGEDLLLLGAGPRPAMHCRLDRRGQTVRAGSVYRAQASVRDIICCTSSSPL